ncbi:cytosolic arginine sensor for mTORC1 subunit 1 isoform X1 [Dendrobates tinctorius]|uniref:cytosolic arginine sensor for mTORC1 subunit 1 isoform X1 n=1 Tax=Dendrobates tinctorius TaxID=92724 RepID=UPI003CC92FBB
MDLQLLEHRVRVTSIDKSGLWFYTHPIVKLLFLRHRTRCKFFSLTETPEDYTLMLDEEGFTELPQSDFLHVAEHTWRVLNVLSNGIQTGGVTKIAKSVIAPLAEHNVSVLMLSTYQTDYILNCKNIDENLIPMTDLSDFQRGQIVGARMAGASVAESAQMLGVARGTVSKVMTAFEREGKMSAAKHRSGRKSKLTERDHRTLKRIVREDRKTRAPKITAELNEHLQNPVSTKTVRRELHKSGFHGRAAIRKPLLSITNVSKHLEWCRNLQNWSLEQLKRGILRRIIGYPISDLWPSVRFGDSRKKHSIQTAF